MPSPDKGNNQSLLRYAGMATQFLFSIGIAVLLGLKADQYLHFSIPLAVWIFPLVMIIVLIISIIRASSKK